MPLISSTGWPTFDPASGEVCRHGVVHRLEPQPAALLALLASRPGTLVTHTEIARHLWPEGTHVDFQAGVHYAVRQVRLALGDRVADGRLVETLPRRGYRLRADALAEPPPAVGGPSTSGADTGSRWRRIGLAIGAVAVVTAVAVVEQRPNDHHARVVALLSTVHDLGADVLRPRRRRESSGRPVAFLGLATNRRPDARPLAEATMALRTATVAGWLVGGGGRGRPALAIRVLPGAFRLDRRRPGRRSLGLAGMRAGRLVGSGDSPSMAGIVGADRLVFA